MHRVGYSLIVYGVLKGNAPDMTLDVTRAEYLFTRPYTVILGSRADIR